MNNENLYQIIRDQNSELKDQSSQITDLQLTQERHKVYFQFGIGFAGLVITILLIPFITGINEKINKVEKLETKLNAIKEYFAPRPADRDIEDGKTLKEIPASKVIEGGVEISIPFNDIIFHDKKGDSHD